MRYNIATLLIMVPDDYAGEEEETMIIEVSGGRSVMVFVVDVGNSVTKTQIGIEMICGKSVSTSPPC